MDESILCMRCFAPRQEERCGVCGWQPGAPGPCDGELAPGSPLRERYFVGRVLGRGGFGITYLGWDTRLRRQRAIKEYFPLGVATRTTDLTTISAVSGQTSLLSDGIEKFLTEARLLARFENHPCIVSPHDFFEENGTAYLVMECLVGETLAHYVQRRGGKIPYALALEFLEPVIRALATLHGAEILHRDVSPENIFLTVDEQSKLLDFGAARQRPPGQLQDMTVILRESYAPPEQYTKSGLQGPWTDVYAVGVTLYRAITGLHPPRSVERLVTDAIRWPSALGIAIPPACEHALMAALALQPGRRPPIDMLLAGLRGEIDLEQRAQQALPSTHASTRSHFVWSALFAALVAAGITAQAVLPHGVSDLWTALPRVVAESGSSLERKALEKQLAKKTRDRRARSERTAPPVRWSIFDDGDEPVPVSSAAPAPAPVLDILEPAPVLATPAARVRAIPPPTFTASAVERTGRLVIRSNVEGSAIEIDGVGRRASEHATFTLEEGPHRIRVHKPGYLPFETEVRLSAGERQTLDARLAIDPVYLETLYRDGLRLLGAAPAERPAGLRRLQRAADLDDPRAEAALAELYAYGQLDQDAPHVVPLDDGRALFFHRRSAARGDTAAQSRLACRLEDGVWPERSERSLPPVAAPRPSLWQRLTGRAPAPFLAVLRAQRRSGAPLDLPEALHWHEAAAARGSARSQKRLGFLYAAGLGTARDESVALHWFLEAARQGDAEAQFVAGMCYAHGAGAPANPDAARCWLRRAAAQRHEPALAELERAGLELAADPEVCEVDSPR